MERGREGEGGKGRGEGRREWEKILTLVCMCVKEMGEMSCEGESREGERDRDG